MDNVQSIERLRITAFNAGRVFEQRRYCRENFANVYNMIETAMQDNTEEIFVKARSIEELLLQQDRNSLYYNRRH